MGRIGPYETIEEHSPGLQVARGPRKTACLVRLSAAGPAQDESGGPTRLMSPAQLLARAEAQAKAAGSPYWAPILDSGTLGDQAYCVYRRYPDSITRYLAFTSVGGKAVWTVLDRILCGLREYRQKANRAHGNLTPANVLLGETRGEWWRTAVLSDPLGDGELDAETAWRDDLHSLGHLLFRLVLQRPPDLHEVPSGDEPWVKALGEAGPAWRAFCADLLDRSRAMDLDEAGSRLASLAPRVPAGHRLRRLLFVLCPVLVLLAAGGWALLNYQRLPPAFRDGAIRLRCLAGLSSYDPDAWRRLCDEYHAWLGAFAERAAEAPAGSAWRTHPYLERLLAMLADAKGPFDPAEIGGEALAYSDLRSVVPERARECGSYDLVLGSLTHVETLRAYLDRAATDRGGWDALRYLSGPLADLCAAGQWAATAQHLRGLAKAIPPPVQGSLRDASQAYAGASAIDAAVEWWTTVGSASRELDERIARLQSTGDPALKRFGDAVVGELAKESARSQGSREDNSQLRGFVADAAKLADLIEAMLAKEWAALPREKQDLWRDEAQRKFVPDASPSLDTYRLWLSELRRLCTDPSLDWVLLARKEDSISGSEVLNLEWRRWRDGILGAPGDPVKPEVRGNDQLRSRVEKRRHFLSSLDAQSILPLALPGRVEAAVQARREATLRQIVALATDEGADVSAFKAAPAVQDLCAVYRRWCHDLPLLAEALAAVRAPLAGLYAYAETVASGAPPPIRALAEAWRGQDVWGAPGLPDELAAACRWVQALADVEAKQPAGNPADRAWLRDQALASSAELPVALAAWRRLGQGDWPKGEEERRDDETIGRQLQQQLAAWNALTPERRADVEREVRAETERRSVRDVLGKLEADPDPALKRFVRFYRDTYAEARNAAGDAGRLAELAATSSLARGLAKVVMQPDWPGEYDRASMAEKLPAPETFSETFYQGWPDQAAGFRLLRPDPRGDPGAWEQTIARMRAAQVALEPFPAERPVAAGQLQEIGALRDEMFATSPIQANREPLQALRSRIETAIATYDRSFAPVADDRLLPAQEWERRLAQWARDIAELAAGNAELEALHGQLGEAVGKLLGTAPISRNAEAITGLLDRIGKIEREIQDGTDPAVWLTRITAREKVATDAVANRVWIGLRAESLDGLTAEKLAADRGLYRGLRERLGAIADFLASRPWEEVLPPTLPPSSAAIPELAWHQDILPGLVRQREEAMTAAARRSAESAQDAEAILAAHGEARRVLALARDQLTLADLRLSEWVLPREPLEAAATGSIGDCLRLWTGARPELAELRRNLPRLDAFCVELFALGASLDRLLAAPTADEVAAAVPEFLKRDEEESRAHPDPAAGFSRRHAACLQLYAGYTRLGETGWPRTLAEMESDLAFSDRLLARLPAAGKEALGRTLEAARRERWGRGFERLADCGAILHGSMALLPRLGLDPRQAAELYTDLAVAARVNLAVASLVGQLEAGARAEAVLAARDEAVKALTRLSTQVKYPDPMVSEIDGRIEQLKAMSGSKDAGLTAPQTSREAAAAVRGLEGCGPGRVGWQPSIDADHTKAHYSTTFGDTTYVLSFVRVRADPQDDRRAAFVCTTEVPVGLFVAACTYLTNKDGRSLGEQMLAFLAEELRPPMPDPRRGPRTWQMQQVGQRTGPAAPPRLWLTETQAFPEANHYAAGNSPPPPTLDQPLQYVPPRAAVFLCLALGCRLSTPYEWQQAAQATPGDPRPPNLRDSTWRQQYEHIRLLAPPPRQGLGLGRLVGGKAEKRWPGADVFPSGAVAEDADAECVSGSDGYLWFREVPGGGRSPVEAFADLAGNVGEFVYDDSRSLDRLLDRPQVTREDLRAELTNYQSKFAVVGESALSRPVPLEQRATPLRIPAATNGWDRGFADVGVRLAFTAPEEKLSERVKALAETLCIVPGGK